MLFSSTVFLFLFLPIVGLVYYLLPNGGGKDLRLRNVWLLVSSLFFYAWGEPTFVLMMLASIVWNYVFGLIVSGRKALLAVSIVGNVLFIGAYKYLNFLTANIREYLPCAVGVIPQTSILLPIGISFFTFQAMSYVVDVYRGMPAQRNPLTLALYISLFPQLVAGPIVRYSTVARQLAVRCSTVGSVSAGLIRFVIGFNKKMLLANPLSEAADYAFAQADPSGALAWLGALCYTLQIYFDFSGYSDMAIGLGKMFGFDFMENFNYPYIARSFSEFWRRWHISLGSWFRDYVYFPLGGSHVQSNLVQLRNLFVVWLLTGVWHGANWTFILWGLIYGVLISFEKISGLSRRLEESRSVVYQLLVLLVVILAWVIFRVPSMTYAVHYIGGMFRFGASFMDQKAIFWWREMSVALCAGVLFALPVYKRLEQGSARVVRLNVLPFVQVILFLVSVSSLVMENHNPFIYFSF